MGIVSEWLKLRIEACPWSDKHRRAIAAAKVVARLADDGDRPELRVDARWAVEDFVDVNLREANPDVLLWGGQMTEQQRMEKLMRLCEIGKRWRRTGDVSRWLQAQLEEFPYVATEHPAMAVALQTIATDADNETMPWELREECRAGVEELFASLLSENRLPPSDEQLAQMWDWFNENAAELLTCGRDELREELEHQTRELVPHLDVVE